MKTLAAISRKDAPAPVIESVDLEEPRAGELLVRLVATGICHTDISVHSRPEPRPMVLGHEGAGIVERVGPGVERFQPGDRVGLSYSFCGHCRNCMSGAHSYCEDMMPRNFVGTREDGTSPISQNGERVYGNFFGQSSFSQYTIAQESSAVKIAADVPIEIVGPLGCGIMTGAGAVLNAFKLRPGQSLAVFGSGSVGLAAVMAAKLAGAERIIAIDKVPSRLALARELGATDTIEAGSENDAEQVRALVPRGVDFSFNTTDVAPVYSAAHDCLAMGGTAGFVTSPNGTVPPLHGKMLYGGQRLRSVLMGDATAANFIPMLIEYHLQGRFPFDKLIKFYPFEKIAEAFHDSETGKTIKPVLRMS